MIFTESTIPHPWVHTLATFAIAVWVMIFGYLLIAYPMMGLVRMWGPIDWSGPVLT